MDQINNWPQAITVIGCAFAIASVFIAIIWNMY
jgi:hypothetical protein